MEANAVTASTAQPAANPPPRTVEGQEGAQSAAPPRRKSAKLKFEVVAGTHQGALLLLDWADYRIGSSPDADIVLSDEGVAPEHAVLHLGPGGVRIDATGGSVTIEHEPLALWRGRRVRLPANVTLGAARIRLSGDGGNDLGPRFDELRRELGRRLLHNPLTGAAVLGCLVIAVTVARELPQTARAGRDGEHSAAAELGAWDRPTSGAANVQAAARELGTPFDAANIRTLRVSTADGRQTSGAADAQSVAEAAARELSTRLDAANIRTLRVSTADGRVAVAGKVTKEEAVSWAAIQQWFDQAYSGSIVLTTEISAAGEGRTMPALQLQAIWYGEHPYILTAGGERYFEGAVLDNGWIIREIGEDRVLLAKGGETVALTYR
jgi:hypothetical protein